MTCSLSQTFIVAAIAVLCGCASQPKNKIALSENADPTQEIYRADQELMDLRNENAFLLAPDPMSRAENLLEDAKEIQSRSKKAPEVIRKVAASLGFSHDAKVQLQETRPLLASVLEARRFADSAGASRAFPKLWIRADQEFQNLSRQILRGQQKSAIARIEDVRRQYLSLEARSAVAVHLQSPRREIETARNNGAARLAPRTLQQAETQYELSRQAIEGSPRNLRVIREAVSSAEQASSRLIQVIRQARADKKISEATILADIEREQLYRNQLEARELELMSLGQMSDENVQLDSEQRAAVLESVIETNERALSLQRKKGETLAEDQHLVLDSEESTPELQRIASQIRPYFSSEEAEVSVQSPAVLIRLKSLDFSDNKPDLHKKNRAVLQRLRKALSQVQPGLIVIEGHSDSSELAANQVPLSLERADAIKKYLSQDAEISSEDIVTMGYGSDRPIESEDFPHAREVNKRIDVYIEPKL